MRNGADPGWALGWVGGKGEANRAWWLWRGNAESLGLVKSAPEPKRMQECGYEDEETPNGTVWRELANPGGEEKQKGGGRS